MKVVLDPENPRDRAPKRMKRIPEIEIEIGARLRALRVAAGLTQSSLGQAVGVTFQQVQKYERGQDRIAASTLQVLAAALKVYPGAFYNSEMLVPIGDVPDVRTALKGAEGLQRIAHPNVRRQLIALIDALANKFELVDEGDP